ncbi:tRNA uridine-5-carboxymethylaminomethyl(34) synthesis GTPase MnmE [Sphingomonas sp. ID0503]|uniref:tRNA uridine-5-carboxymethylaminomethyl(34) synthesis GTPase MnmE n=1 Tax=Sphingomonas sp. ID0503 TaxID=3399691 RepID=UPI003AFAFB44
MPDTIFALSSGAPPAAIAVIRISGSRASEALAASLAGTLPEPRRASLRTVRDAAGEVLDRALILWFPAPDTATGEDLVELHLHGGRAVVAAVLNHLASLRLRPAVAGEFTRRAFDNGRIDLMEAEGLADLLSAETELQRRAAISMADGGLSRQVEAWRSEVLSLAAMVEAAIDFSDEGEVGEMDLAPVRQGIGKLHADMTHIAAQPPLERIKQGIRVVIAGPPNAGKSSLLNRLVDKEAAIVSEIAGTTRDLIEAPIAIGGVPFVFADTAGLRDATDDPIEVIGIERARTGVNTADIVLWLDRTSPPEDFAERTIWVGAKGDIEAAPEGSLVTSAVTGLGIDELRAEILRRAGWLLPAQDGAIINVRQRAFIEASGAALRAAAELEDVVLLAEALRVVRSNLDALSGRAGVEDVLDALFGRFCIGK